MSRGRRKRTWQKLLRLPCCISTSGSAGFPCNLQKNLRHVQGFVFLHTASFWFFVFLWRRKILIIDSSEMMHNLVLHLHSSQRHLFSSNCVLLGCSVGGIYLYSCVLENYSAFCSADCCVIEMTFFSAGLLWNTVVIGFSVISSGYYISKRPLREKSR